MTKIRYPKNGLSSVCRGNFTDCTTNLKKANDNTDYSIPSNFAYKNYMITLRDTMKKYVNELNAIGGKIAATTKSYEDLENDLIQKTKLIKPHEVKPLGRMIKS